MFNKYQFVTNGKDITWESMAWDDDPGKPLVESVTLFLSLDYLACVNPTQSKFTDFSRSSMAYKCKSISCFPKEDNLCLRLTKGHEFTASFPSECESLEMPLFRLHWFILFIFCSVRKSKALSCNGDSNWWVAFSHWVYLSPLWLGAHCRRSVNRVSIARHIMGCSMRFYRRWYDPL